MFVSILLIVGNRQHTCRKSRDREHHISAISLGSCFLESDGMLVLHAVGHRQRAWSSGL